MNKETIELLSLKSRTLAKQIFKADVPEKIIKQLPAQSLYMAIKENGLQSSSELIEITTQEQLRLILDFDCWTKDEFQEDNFWEWLAVTDATDALELLEKILSSTDLKWVALIIGRYVEVVTHEEPTEEVPGPGFYTPDKGYTWINITIEDKDKEFYLGRLLALIFDTNVELFYQLVSISQVSTVTMLEEESFEDKEKRMRSEGIFTMEEAFAIHEGMQEGGLKKQLALKEDKPLRNDVPVVSPLLYDGVALQPLDALLESIADKESALSELTTLINSAIVRWSIPFHDLEEVRIVADKVKGALNAGLELALKECEISAHDLYAQIGLLPLYQRGLFSCMELRRKAHSISEKRLETIASDNQALFSIIAHLRADFPELPLFVSKEGSIQYTDDERLLEGRRAIERVRDIEFVNDLFKKLAN